MFTSPTVTLEEQSEYKCSLVVSSSPGAVAASPTMSYGSIDGGAFGSRNPFGGPARQGYQLVGEDEY